MRSSSIGFLTARIVHQRGTCHACKFSNRSRKIQSLHRPLKDHENDERQSKLEKTIDSRHHHLFATEAILAAPQKQAATQRRSLLISP